MTDERTLENCPRGTPGHDWQVAGTEIEGRGSFTTSVVEVCNNCHAIKRDDDAVVISDE